MLTTYKLFVVIYGGIMSVLFDRLSLYCSQIGLSFYAIENATGLTVGSLRKWKDSMPSGDKILKVSNFLGVSMDYLMGNTDNPESQKNNPQDLVAAAEEIAAVINEFQMQTQDLIIKLNKILDKYHIDSTILAQTSTQPEKD